MHPRFPFTVGKLRRGGKRRHLLERGVAARRPFGSVVDRLLGRGGLLDLALSRRRRGRSRSRLGLRRGRGTRCGGGRWCGGRRRGGLPRTRGQGQQGRQGKRS
ncbi:MAG: hypothetical protein E6K32_01385 [Gammaproteobacteria bacterium]|nr:MAG: hypothetical protein E6K32_01385 [Gammaproteobacteria bacterium]